MKEISTAHLRHLHGLLGETVYKLSQVRFTQFASGRFGVQPSTPIIAPARLASAWTWSVLTARNWNCECNSAANNRPGIGGVSSLQQCTKTGFAAPVMQLVGCSSLDRSGKESLNSATFDDVGQHLAHAELACARARSNVKRFLAGVC